MMEFLKHIFLFFCTIGVHSQNGLPQDVTVTTRFMQTLRSIFPKFLTRAVVEHMINSRINHDILGIRSR